MCVSYNKISGALTAIKTMQNKLSTSLQSPSFSLQQIMSMNLTDGVANQQE